MKTKRKRTRLDKKWKRQCDATKYVIHVQRLARGELAEADPPRQLRRVGAVGVRQLDAEVALAFGVRPKMRRRVADVANAGGDPPRRLKRARLLHRRERPVKHPRAAPARPPPPPALPPPPRLG